MKIKSIHIKSAIANHIDVTCNEHPYPVNELKSISVSALILITDGPSFTIDVEIPAKNDGWDNYIRKVLSSIES